MIYKAAFFLCLIAIEYLATTSLHIEIVETLWDKFNHFFAFATLMVLLTLAYGHLTQLQRVALLLAFGIQIELVQAFLPSRYFSLLDVVADTIGIAVGIVIIWLFKRFSCSSRFFS
ncbi:MAG: VanZ family protein [Epsilonproteobacteria bacterium]|nr:VanZ family protein [Campylobacterota bacterium]